MTKFNDNVLRDVGEADLIIAGVVETPIKGGIVGPTFACLLAHQFAVLRASDRFWYENDIPPSSFTKGKNFKFYNSCGMCYNYSVRKKEDSVILF